MTLCPFYSGCGRTLSLLCAAVDDVVTKTLHVKTETKAEAVYLVTETEAQGSGSIFLADRPNGRGCATVLRLSVCLCIYCG